ncbi:hypothetical protein [Nitratireductor alexandrii]|uniref:hypothetical protein n=1 Tax=Nitratireductor alexandrii TaxID=2448161 RepID=UPI000FD6FF0F|nr:hypothetical protein [Nitratireductor alexandrii]
MDTRTKGSVTRREQIAYLNGQLREMREIAASAGLQLTAYFVEMAYLELSDTIREERIFAESDKQSADLSHRLAAE